VIVGEALGAVVGAELLLVIVGKELGTVLGEVLGSELGEVLISDITGSGKGARNRTRRSAWSSTRWSADMDDRLALGQGLGYSTPRT
jgi:hypothetical protein